MNMCVHAILYTGNMNYIYKLWLLNDGQHKSFIVFFLHIFGIYIHWNCYFYLIITLSAMAFHSSKNNFCGFNWTLADALRMAHCFMFLVLSVFYHFVNGIKMVLKGCSNRVVVMTFAGQRINHGKATHNHRTQPGTNNLSVIYKYPNDKYINYT